MDFEKTYFHEGKIRFYEELYSRVLGNKKYNVIDLGAGVNGFSYKYFRGNLKSYFAVEAIGQLVELTNNYFEKHKFNGKCYHMSLFELKKLKKYIKQN